MNPQPPRGQTGLHQWMGTVGPHPDLVTAVGAGLLALAGVPLMAATPSWWATTVGPVALVANLAAAWWQAGAHRVVTADSTGIHVRRKARWADQILAEIGTMPRMPIGPMSGRWCRCDLGGVRLWIHRSEFGRIDRFDDDFRARFSS